MTHLPEEKQQRNRKMKVRCVSFFAHTFSDHNFFMLMNNFFRVNRSRIKELDLEPFYASKLMAWVFRWCVNRKRSVFVQLLWNLSGTVGGKLRLREKESQISSRKIIKQAKAIASPLRRLLLPFIILLFNHPPPKPHKTEQNNQATNERQRANTRSLRNISAEKLISPEGHRQRALVLLLRHSAFMWIFIDLLPWRPSGHHTKTPQASVSSLLRRRENKREKNGEKKIIKVFFSASVWYPLFFRVRSALYPHKTRHIRRSTAEKNRVESLDEKWNFINEKERTKKKLNRCIADTGGIHKRAGRMMWRGSEQEGARKMEGIVM